RRSARRAADRRHRARAPRRHRRARPARGLRRRRRQGRHPPPEPRRRLPRHHLAPGRARARGRPHRNEGLTMTTLIDTAPSRPASAPALVRARPAGLTAEAVFIRRSITHSLRDTEALLMAVILPTMLMLLFTYVF